MNDSMLLLPAEAAERIRGSGRYGDFACRTSLGDNLAAVTKLRSENGPMMPTRLPPRHWLLTADEHANGRWYRVAAELHGLWWHLWHRAGTTLKPEAFAGFITAGLYNGVHIALTYAPDVESAYPEVGVPDIVGWHFDPSNGVAPMSVAREPDQPPGMRQLLPGWPSDKLADTSVMVVGAGSIGGAVAIDLATYGVGHLTLVDPDRILWHNLVRHVSSIRDVGRHKVSALAEQIHDQRPDTTVDPRTLDVVAEADQIRGLLADTDVVVCAADGVAPRRVVSHLARRSETDAVLACVLEDGAVGEILRLRPWPGRGCLLCHRAHLRDSDGMDPEPGLDAPYGLGTRHLPMTAVGADLHLVGNLAAKIVVATMLERRGQADQLLPGEQAVLGLRPARQLTAPYDVARAGEIKWSDGWPSRSQCPTCGSA